MIILKMKRIKILLKLIHRLMRRQLSVELIRKELAEKHPELLKLMDKLDGEN